MFVLGRARCLLSSQTWKRGSGRAATHAADRLPSLGYSDPSKSFSTIPVIDVAPFVDAASKRSEQERVVEQLGNACQDAGFFYVAGHGVPRRLMDDVLHVSHEFFSLPDEEKENIALSPATAYRGYQKIGMNVTKGRADFHEGIDYFKEFSRDDPGAKLGAPLHGPNQWPELPRGFRSTMEEYMRQMHGLGKTIMRGIAASLRLPPTSFEGDSAGGDAFHIMRVIGYPPQRSDGVGESVGCAEHTDYGLLTFVHQDPNVTALEVKNREGQWVPAHPIPGTFVVNIGDMLKIWTNGLYIPTPHRVLNRSDMYRVSVPYFYEPNFNTKVEPLDAFTEGGKRRAQFEPIVYGEHLIKKVTNNFG